MARKYSMDRRAYLKALGASGVTVTLAGCTGDGGDGGGDGDGGGTPTATPTPTPRPVTTGTAPGFPPFEIKEGGELKGFDVDLAEAVIAEADGFAHAGWKEFEFDALTPALTSDKIDLIAAAMTITDQRAEQIAFSDPYYEANQAVLVQADGDFSPESTDDLSGRVVGAQSGTTGEGQIDDLVEEGVVAEDDKRVYDNYTLAVTDLENGNVDAIIIDVPVARNFESNRDVSVAFVIETGEEYGLGMRQDDDRISDINDALATVREDGTYDDLVEEYFT